MQDHDIEQLLYKNYLVEQEMLDRLSIIDIKRSGVLNEAAVEALNEDMKDTILTAIRKIMANIQMVWDKFKANVATDIDMKRIMMYKKYLETDYKLPMPKDFAVPHLDEYNKMMDVDIPVFQENMLEELENEKEFTRLHFGYFYDENKPPKQVAEEKIIEIAKEDGKTTVDKDVVADYIKLLEKFKANAMSIADDIKNLNNSSRSMDNLLAQAVNAAANIADTYSYYFTEEEKETFASVSKEEQEKANGGEEKPEENKEGGEEKKKDNSAISKKINAYFKICNSILSTKLSITSKVRSACTTIVIQFGKVQDDIEKSKGMTTAKKAEPKTEEPQEQNTTGTAQVKI